MSERGNWPLLKELCPMPRGEMPADNSRALNHVGCIGATRQEIDRIWNLIQASKLPVAKQVHGE